MTNNRWMIYNKDISQAALETGIDKRILKILANRDIGDPDKIQMFLDPSMDKMYDPFLMKDMDRAVDLILDAVDAGKHIHIVGDYDQDGNSSIVILMKGLGLIHDRLSYSIPDRQTDGYGINKRLVDEAAEFDASLILTCDNGISAHEPVAYAKSLGMQVVVTDHHQVSMEGEKQILPPADAVLNPHRLDDSYPFKELCGAGVAFKLIQAIHQVLGIDEDITNDLVQFAAMGTICDVVDLVDENRIIAKQGLKRLNQTDNLGVIHLTNEAGWTREISSYALGFVLGPCINASGRLSTARLGAELFLEEDEDLVRNYAAELVRLNEERKALTEEAFDKANELVQAGKKQDKDVIVLYVPGIHESIAGIVAGRIKDKYHRPTIILTESQTEGILKGSGRSIKNYNIFKKVSEVKNLTESFGGHEMACGLSIKDYNLQGLEVYLTKNSGLSEHDLQREITIDIQENIDDLDMFFIRSLEKLGPFGKANPSPKLADRGLNVLSFGLIGKNKNVLKMNLEKNGQVREAILFNQAAEFYDYLLGAFGQGQAYNPNDLSKNLIDLVYKPDINDFNGQRSIQLRVEDLRVARS